MIDGPASLGVAAGGQPPAHRAGPAVSARHRRLGGLKSCSSSSPSEATRCCAAESPRTSRSSAPTSPPPSRRSPSSRREHDVVVTHGNGPQVGLLALQGEAYRAAEPYPLDVLGAETEGMIGYLLDQELVNRARRPPPGRHAAHAGDRRRRRPGVQAPDEVRSARSIEDADGATSWPPTAAGPSPRTAAAGAASSRRPSPARSSSSARSGCSLDAGVLVICAGGGGIPVVVDREGRPARRRGRDRQGPRGGAARGGPRRRRAADAHRRPRRRGRLGHARRPRTSTTSDVGELRELDFAPGSMGPKVEAACRFAERTGGIAGIGALADAAEIIAGDAGTIVAGARSRGRGRPRAPPAAALPAASAAHQP